MHPAVLTRDEAERPPGAFHLRTLAKYGFVEEAGGGKGRERPWRQVYDGMSWRTLTRRRCRTGKRPATN